MFAFSSTCATAAFSVAEILALPAVALHKWQKKIGGYLGKLVSKMVAESQAMETSFITRAMQVAAVIC